MTEDRVERRLAAIMAVDVAGYSRLMGVDVSVVDAVRCAVDIQRGMIERDADVPAASRIRLRIGSTSTLRASRKLGDWRKHARRVVQMKETHPELSIAWIEQNVPYSPAATKFIEGMRKAGLP